MKHPFFLSLFFILSFSHDFAFSGPGDKPKRFSINGNIRDQHTGESLVGATIFVKELKTGAVSDIYGNYSLTINEGSYALVYSYIGYSTIEKTVVLNKDLKISMELVPQEHQLKEVEIMSEKNDKNVVKPEMSTFRMDIKTIERIPALFGEVDIIKAIQMLPGVQSVGEGSSGFSVRGTCSSQSGFIGSWSAHCTYRSFSNCSVVGCIPWPRCPKLKPL